MTLTRYGSDVIIAVAIIALLLIGLALWTDEVWVKAILIAVAAFLVIFSANFFRDPERTIALGGRDVNKCIVCPADGEVVVISEENEPEYLKGKAKMISIFMSPLNVHVNRSPMTGVVEYYRYAKGKFLVASKPEATHENERAIIGLNSNGRKITFSQVTGFVARRIVCEAKVGDTLHAGVRYGMIKFGSRVDVFLPLDAKLHVTMNEMVVAGETILAELP